MKIYLYTINLYIFLKKRLRGGGRGAFAIFLGGLTPLKLGRLTEQGVLLISKGIFDYYNSNFSLEITSKVQKVNQKYTFTQTNHQMQLSDKIFIF